MDSAASVDVGARDAYHRVVALTKPKPRFIIKGSVGSRRFGQVRFRAISGDHVGAKLPHLHADIGSGEVIVELLPGNAARLSRAHGEPIRGKVTVREVKIVLDTACEFYLDLISLWEASQPT